ncbi:hypothetical protein IGI37_003062 [Enterococcus sp. AZ194]|uniref:WxL domain-containing protein n=1 Tax=Enterococcus sp. AZ194 TaxID=2774629 RepID=UPI003F206F50
MKTKTLLGATLLTVGVLLPTAIVQAETTVPTPETTQGTVGLIVNPDTDHPGAGDGDGGDTGQKGDFTLDHTVSYDFGQQAIDGKKMTLNATQEKPYVQVTDLREQSSGWQLLTKITEFKTADETNPKVLSGAQLTLPMGTAEAVDDTNTSAKPTTAQVVLNSEDGTLFGANANAGVGSWMDKMYDTPTTLYIPAGATPGAYSATITWTLQDAPSGTL